MARYTIVYVPEDAGPQTYGLFRSRENAEKTAERMERSLDEFRDAAGGDVGEVWVAKIERARDWGRT